MTNETETAEAPSKAGPPQDLKDMAELVSLCKRRGFVFPSSEIYGGINACWDYGPLGIELKRNVKEAWWRAMTDRDDVEGSTPRSSCTPKSGKPRATSQALSIRWSTAKSAKAASAPTSSTSPMRSKPSKTWPKLRRRADRAPQFQPHVQDLHGPARRRGQRSSICAPKPRRAFTSTSSTSSNPRVRRSPSASRRSARRSATKSRPATSFSARASSSRWRCSSSSSRARTWSGSRSGRRRACSGTWIIGIRKDKLRFHEHGPGELAHYAKAAFDIEYEFPFGWQELEGIHNRSDFDLGQHQQFSGKKLEYFDEEQGALPPVHRRDFGRLRPLPCSSRSSTLTASTANELGSNSIRACTLQGRDLPSDEKARAH